MNEKFLTYESFGAKGDGVTDDFEAIIATHEEANRTKTPVKAREGAAYYIGGSKRSAVVKTDLDLTGAKIIIDDRALESITSYVYSVESDFESFPIELGELRKDTKKLDIGAPGEYFVKVYNENERIYIRKGLNKNNGTATQEVFIVKADGTVFPSISFDYKEITKAYARRTDDEPIVIKGGHIVTIANEQESFYRYHQRGFGVKRSHVTFTDIYHTVEGEGDHGAPYHGFIRADEAYDLTIKNALMTPRFIYLTPSQIPGKLVKMGSYDLSFWSSIDVKCINVKQTIDINDTRYWGIYTSNFCKELLLKDCELSRFDAHQGVTNAVIKGCRLGHQHINLIGHGEFLIEDSSLDYGDGFINLRGDYGSFFNGNITVRNCTWYNPSPRSAIINGNNEGDHNYGYVCPFGVNIVIDGFKVIDGEHKGEEGRRFYLIKNNSFDQSLPYASVPPKTVSVKNIELESGLEYENCNDERNAHLITFIKED